MITLKSIIEEAKLNSKTKVQEANETYFKSATEAVMYARTQAEKRGFEIDPQD